MARTPIIGGCRDGTEFLCTCGGECDCESFGCCLSNNIADGFLLWQMYAKVDGAFRPSHVKKQVMISNGVCPRCGLFMGSEVEICNNCGARMNFELE